MPYPMRAFAALCGKELRLLSRDRHGLLVLFAVPTLFILIMSLSLRDAFRADAGFSIAVSVIDEDGGTLAHDFVGTLWQQQGFRQVAAEDADVVIHVVPGFSEFLATRHELAASFRDGVAEPPMLQLEFQPSVLPQLRAAAALSVRQCLLSVQSDYLMAEVMGYSDAEMQTMRYLGDPRRLPVEERYRSADGTPAVTPTSVQQNVPAWLIFAMFFAVIPLASAFVVERQQGSLLRLRVLGVSSTLLLASKVLPYYLVNLLQMVVMIAIGVWLVPALGGDRFTVGHSVFGLWMIGTATSLAAIGLALLVAVRVRTTLQATIAGGAISLILAALGGVMVPKLVMPATMQQLTGVSPMAWSLEGFWDIVLRQGGWQDALPEAMSLAGFGLSCLALAAGLLRRNSTNTTTTP
ncbi:ABC transporter permease [Sinimarinibacterium sp. CAU 1509]|uniref:ABC transporter permease n=1 Tax=Sinimarinibacterium sp. CAU 1509 TaxID=2562283 RepID=UPI0010AB6527|nr:ABC transporter permease [Sinimarinibacterium sp. CAU 1509]TJY62323.1 ABC transporter permease [Sinimarinibacterium sp. CAU 1509]